MKTRPIIFQPDMVKAILDGRKSQTRRVVKPQPQKQHHMAKDPDLSREGRNIVPWAVLTNAGNVVESFIKCPYGVPGDRLWVRETFAFHNFCYPKSEGARITYKADREVHGIKWKPSIHMPFTYCRLTLEITNIRVERVQEISIGDIKSEGIADPWKVAIDTDPWGVFADLWDKMHKKRGFGWSENPWVWVIEFKKGGI